MLYNNDGYGGTHMVVLLQEEEEFAIGNVSDMYRYYNPPKLSTVYFLRRIEIKIQ